MGELGINVNSVRKGIARHRGAQYLDMSILGYFLLPFSPSVGGYLPSSPPKRYRPTASGEGRQSGGGAY